MSEVAFISQGGAGDPDPRPIAGLLLYKKGSGINASTLGATLKSVGIRLALVPVEDLDCLKVVKLV